MVPDIDTLKTRIRDALAAVTEDMLEKTWRKIEYRLNVLREINGAHVECTNIAQKLFEPR
jgi:hypothetical protein